MSLSSFTIADGTGATVLSELDTAFSALSSWFAGSTDPSSAGYAVAYCWWIDTGNSLVKQRNSSNDAWITKGQILSNGTVLWETTEVSIASAASLDLGDTQGNLIIVSGTTEITALGTADAGIRRTLYFSSALTIAYSSSAIILPGSADVTVSAGDVMEFLSFGSGLWKCISYYSAIGVNKASGDFAVGGALAVTGNETVGGTLAVTGKGTFSGNVSVSGNLIVTDSITINGTAVSTSSIPAGVTGYYPSSSPPDGWLLCNGAAVSRTTYASLFSLLGTTFGTGDGSTTFNLPNTQNKFILCEGSTYSTLGGTGGEAAHTLSVSEIPSHSHSFSVPEDTSDNYESSNGYVATTGVTNASFSTGAAGGGGSHNNMPPYIVLYAIIKY